MTPKRSLKKIASVANRSLFVNLLRALPNHDQRRVRENFLTAALAGTLTSSLAFRRRFVRLLVGTDRFKGEQISRSHITASAEEVVVRGKSGSPKLYRLDLVLGINGRLKIIVEIKLYASEGIDADGNRQLDQYTALRGFDGVAYLTAVETTVSSRTWARRTSKYLCPRDGHGVPVRRHFLWSDVHREVSRLERGRHTPPLIPSFRLFLEWLGLRPVHPLIGELGGRTAFKDASKTVQANRRFIQLSMQQVQPWFYERDWETAAVRNNGTLYAWPNDKHHPIWRIWISPSLIPGILRIWIELAQKRNQRKLEQTLVKKLGGALIASVGYDLLPIVRLVAEKTERPSVDVQIPYHTILRGLQARQRIGLRLLLTIESVVLVAERALARS